MADAAPVPEAKVDETIVLALMWAVPAVRDLVVGRKVVEAAVKVGVSSIVSPLIIPAFVRELVG